VFCWYYTLQSVGCSSDVYGAALCSAVSNTEADSQRCTPVSNDPPSLETYLYGVNRYVTISTIVLPNMQSLLYTVHTVS
jgi:hypothetical protein